MESKLSTEKTNIAQIMRMGPERHKEEVQTKKSEPENYRSRKKSGALLPDGMLVGTGGHPSDFLENSIETGFGIKT